MVRISTKLDPVIPRSIVATVSIANYYFRGTNAGVNFFKIRENSVHSMPCVSQEWLLMPRGSDKYGVALFGVCALYNICWIQDSSHCLEKSLVYTITIVDDCWALQTNYLDPTPGIPKNTTQHQDVPFQSTLARLPMYHSQNGPIESECNLNNVNSHIIRNQYQISNK